METVTYPIDLNQIAELGHVGIRRTAIFMGLGLNAAHDPSFKNYKLVNLQNDPDRLSIELIGDVNEARVEVFKGAFADWIIVCGLRELLEHYGLLLARIHHDAMLVLQSKGHLQHMTADPNAMQRSHFENPGIAAKLQELRSRFKISTEYEEHIIQLYKLRNTLDHNFKTVHGKRLDAEGKLIVRWLAFEAFGVTETTSRKRLLREMRETADNEGTLIMGRWATREKIYNRGDVVDVSRYDLLEICLFFKAKCIPSIVQSFGRFLGKHIQVPE